MFFRRAFSIDSLAVGMTEDPAISRTTIAVSDDEYVTEQVEEQFNKLIPVIKVKRFDDTGSLISCELALTKVSCMSQYRPEIIQIAELFHARVVDVSLTSLTIQFADTAEEIEIMLTLLKPYGTKKIAHMSTVTLEQGPQVTGKQNVRANLANET